MNFFVSGEHAYKRYAVYEYDDIMYDPTFVYDLRTDDPRYQELERQISEDIITRYESVEEMMGDSIRVGDELRTFTNRSWRTAWHAPDPVDAEEQRVIALQLWYPAQDGVEGPKARFASPELIAACQAEGLYDQPGEVFAAWAEVTRPLPTRTGMSCDRFGCDLAGRCRICEAFSAYFHRRWGFFST